MANTAQRSILRIVPVPAVVLWAAMAFAADPPPPSVAPPVLPVGPYVRYDAPRSATICWETESKSPSIVVIHGKGFDNRRIEDKTPRTRHSLTVTGLAPKTTYSYQVIRVVGGRETPARRLEMHTRFNYAVPPVGDKAKPFGDNQIYAKAAGQILKQTGADRGYCLVYGFGKGRLAYELAKRSRLIVVGLEEDATAVAEARRLLSKAGVYGSRITVHHVKSLSKSPVTRFFANLIVSETMISQGRCPGAAGEMFRMLRPVGGVACLGRPAGAPGSLTRDALSAWLKAGKVDGKVSTEGGLWAVVRRGALGGAGQWTHQYGTAGNAAFAGETLSGAGSTSEMEVQWIGRPGADFGLDRNPRMPAPLSINGRLYHQGMHKIVALDAYNGALLWLMEIPDLLRVNMPRDASNWCIDQERVYAAIRSRCWALDGPTGGLATTYRLPDRADEKAYDWGYVASVGDTLLGSCVKKGSAYRNFWTQASWYDAFTGPATAKVCSDKLFAVDKKTGRTRWVYKSPMIINATIAAGGGRVYFIVCRDKKILASKTARIADAQLWSALSRVALDVRTGKRIWEHRMEPGTAPGNTVYYLAWADDRLVLVASSGQVTGRGRGKRVTGTYNIYTYDAKTGTPGWKAAHAWVKGDHGAHMQHPVITSRALYLEPCGYDIKTGKVISNKVGPRQGCATFAGTTNALLHRGPGRRSAMWNQTTQQDSTWTAFRPSCWLSMIPAGGMILAPEGGGGCSCGGWIETSLGFLPKKTRPAGAKQGGSK